MTLSVSEPRAGSGLAAGLQGTVVVAHRDLLRQLRNPGILIAQAVQLVFFVLVYAVGFNSMVGSVGGTSFSAFVYPGIVSIQVVMIGMTSGLSYAMDRQFGVLREMQVAPVPRVCLPAGKIAATCLELTVQAMLMLLAAPLLGLRLTPGSYFAGVAVFAVTAALFGLIGLLLAASVKHVETLQGVVQLAMYPLLFLSGSVFRPDSVPRWLSMLMQVNPMTYAVDLARHELLRTGPSAGFLPLGRDAAVMGGLVLVFGLALRLKVGK